MVHPTPIPIVRWMAGMLVCLFCMPAVATVTREKPAPGREMARQATWGQKLWITADHTKFDALKQTFASGPEVTRACLGCHSEAAIQFHKTIHWTWIDPNSGKDEQLGKGGLSVNNF